MGWAVQGGWGGMWIDRGAVGSANRARRPRDPPPQSQPFPRGVIETVHLKLKKSWYTADCLRMKFGAHYAREA